MESRREKNNKDIDDQILIDAVMANMSKLMDEKLANFSADMRRSITERKRRNQNRSATEQYHSHSSRSYDSRRSKYEPEQILRREGREHKQGNLEQQKKFRKQEGHGIYHHDEPRSAGKTKHLQDKLSEQKLYEETRKQMLEILNSMKFTQKKSPANLHSIATETTKEKLSCSKELSIQRDKKQPRPSSSDSHTSLEAKCNIPLFQSEVMHEKLTNLEPVQPSSNVSVPQVLEEELQEESHAESPMSLPLVINLEQPIQLVQEPSRLPLACDYPRKHCKEIDLDRIEPYMFILVSTQEEKRFGLESVKEFCVSKSIFDQMIINFETIRFEKFLKPEGFLFDEIREFESSLRVSLTNNAFELSRTEIESALVKTFPNLNPILENVSCGSNSVSELCKPTLRDHDIDNSLSKFTKIITISSIMHLFFVMSDQKETGSMEKHKYLEAKDALNTLEIKEKPPDTCQQTPKQPKGSHSTSAPFISKYCCMSLTMPKQAVPSKFEPSLQENQDVERPESLPPIKEFMQEQAEKNAPHTLIEKLTQSLTLALPDLTKTLEVTFDASSVGIGFVLMQGNMPIAYFKEKYPPWPKEFVPHTDQEFIKYQKDQSTLNNEPARWTEFFETIPKVNKSKKGTDNAFPDARYVLLIPLESKLLGIEQIKSLYASNSDLGKDYASYGKYANNNDGFLSYGNCFGVTNLSLSNVSTEEAPGGAETGVKDQPPDTLLVFQPYYNHQQASRWTSAIIIRARDKEHELDQIRIYVLKEPFMDHTDIIRLFLSKRSNAGYGARLKRPKRTTRREEDNRFKPPDLDQDKHQDVRSLIMIKEAPPDATNKPKPNLNIQGKYHPSSSFTFTDLVFLFAGKTDLRTNPFQVGEDDAIMASRETKETKEDEEQLKEAKEQHEPEESEDKDLHVPLGPMTRSKAVSFKQPINQLLHTIQANLSLLIQPHWL